MTASPSTLDGLVEAALFLSPSPSPSSFMKSDWIVARRFSHHAFSDSVVSWISSRRLRTTVLAAISLADWKMVWPQLGERALAWKMEG